MYSSISVWQNQTAILGIYRDISERKKVEEEQEKARDELEHLVNERTSELVEAAEEMERKHNELLFHRSELEKVNQELLDTNKALTALARNIDREREDAEKRIAKIVRSRMLPLLEDFQKNVSFKKYLAEINELMLSLHELSPGLKKSSDILLALSPTELRIATMIKNGLTSPAIANVLHISIDTVKSHRRNIRKKLKFNNSRINLASYLEAKM
jgi:DNA-binding CsgD family transcriptional regulator